ncbi:MAG: rod shape-determining protein RodA [Myxococcota bacterium]
MKSAASAARFDWPLAVAVVAITALGMLNLHSATHASRPQLYLQQVTWIGVGVLAFLAAAALDYRLLLRFAYPLYLAGIAALVAVLAFGRTVNGSRRWIELGGLSIQPSEFMKLLVTLAIARYLQQTPAPEGRAIAHVAIPTAIAAVPVALILRQPDLGTALLLFLVFSTLMLLAGLRLRSIVTLAVLAIVAAPLTWVYLLKDYQRTRILTFLSPGSDPVGAGWHARQALVAVGSGGLWGKGWLRGTQTQLHFLPEQWTDFPFAVWAEEWGLAGTLVLIALYLFLIARALVLASQARDRFGGVICAGVAALIFWHAAINIGMVAGVLPVVGVTLPLFSYGGSSVVTVLAGAGLLMSVSLRRHAL